jgi:hypothetical protein
MPSARDLILKHIDVVNDDRNSDADPWAADAEITAPGAQVSGRANVIGFLAMFQEALPDLRLEIAQLLTDGPAAARSGKRRSRRPRGAACRRVSGSSPNSPEDPLMNRDFAFSRRRTSD